MNSLRGGFLKGLRGVSLQPRSSLGLNRVSQSWYSTTTFDEFEEKDEIDDGDFINHRKELEPQGVDPKKGWGFRGVHKAIICGKVGQAPVQKILRNGRTVTIFTVGTGGMYDQRIVGGAHLPRPAQWHRIVVHNEYLGAYSVQQLMKDSAVFVEGDIETRVYNDAIGGQVKNVPEICVRRDDDVTIEEDVERKAGWLLKLFFVGTFGFVGYQFFPYMGDNLLQQSISLLHVKDPLFKRMGASRLSRFAIDDERRMKVVERGGALHLLTMLETAKDDKTRKEALKALVALSHSDLAAEALHQAGAIPIVSSTPNSSEYAEVETCKSNLLKRFEELKTQ